MANPVGGALSVKVMTAMQGDLSAAFGTTAAVEIYPDDPKKYTPSHVRGALLIHYRNSNYKSEGSVKVRQRNLRIEVFVCARKYTDALLMMEEGIEATWCMKPLPDSKTYMELVADGFVAYNDEKKLFFYSFTLEYPVLFYPQPQT